MSNYVITGANSWLGREMAAYLGQSQENRIYLATRGRFDVAGILSKDVRHLSGIDLLKEECLRLLAEEADKFFDGPFHIINCVGYYKGQDVFDQVSLAESDLIFDSNFKTVYNTARILIPVMIKKGGGHFIGFSCNSVRFNYPQMAPFTSAKAALESLIKCLANEYYGRNIYAHALQLATLRTEKEMMVKPCGDHANWLDPVDVARYVEMLIGQPVQLSNGNIVSLYQYSDSFFNQAYFDRIKKY